MNQLTTLIKNLEYACEMTGKFKPRRYLNNSFSNLKEAKGLLMELHDYLTDSFDEEKVNYKSDVKVEEPSIAQIKDLVGADKQLKAFQGQTTTKKLKRLRLAVQSLEFGIMSLMNDEEKELTQAGMKVNANPQIISLLLRNATMSVKKAGVWVDEMLYKE